MKTIILVCALIFFQTVLEGRNINPPKDADKLKVVVIDPGHGGKDPGAIGSRVKEKDVVLNISLMLGSYIEENFDDVEVIYTRTTDVAIGLDDRPEIANRHKADLFISIHANSLPNSPAFGTETFVMGINKDARNFEVAKKENSVMILEENYETKYEGFDPNSIDSYIIFSVMQKTFQAHSIAFAQMVEDEFKNRAQRNSRGVKQDGFWVLWRTTMPSVLIETGFLTHAEEEKYLASKEGQEIIASAIFRAFRRYKESIEKNSNFEALIIDETAKKEEKTPVARPTEASETETGLYFKVQVVVSRSEMAPDDPFFKSWDHVEEFKVGSWYKYAVGKTASYKEIIDLCTQVKKDYPDAFVIAVKNGEVVKLKYALEEINK